MTISRGASHAHDFDAVGDRLDLPFEALRLAGVGKLKPQVFCRRRGGDHCTELTHPRDDMLSAVGKVALVAQLDPQDDGAVGECSVARVRIEGYASRIGAAPVQGVEHGEHNLADRRCRVGLIEIADDSAHGCRLPCLASPPGPLSTM